MQRRRSTVYIKRLREHTIWKPSNRKECSERTIQRTIIRVCSSPQYLKNEFCFVKNAGCISEEDVANLKNIIKSMAQQTAVYMILSIHVAYTIWGIR